MKRASFAVISQQLHVAPYRQPGWEMGLDGDSSCKPEQNKARATMCGLDISGCQASAHLKKTPFVSFSHAANSAFFVK